MDAEIKPCQNPPEPHRRFVLHMKVDGDTWEDVQRMVARYAEIVAETEPADVWIFSGGPTGGGWMYAVEDPDMTHGRWARENSAWVKAARERRARASAEEKPL